jgi:DsbC/DsbD-like thiol-disulfide interchange protein
VAWAVLAAPPALAASTPWQDNEGGAVRLVTAGPPDAQGRVKGLIDIFLKPGWKTYWRDPGSAGVPPSLDVSTGGGVKAAEIHFPAPERHHDDYGSWAGYGASVALPVTFRLADPSGLGRIEAELFLGVCQTICLPVQARFSLDAGAGDEPEDVASVEAAFAALPEPAAVGQEVVGKGLSGDMLLLEARLPDGIAPRDLFLAGSELGYAFGVPAISREGGAWRIAVPVSERPAAPSREPIPYTLTTDRRAIAGEIPPP